MTKSVFTLAFILSHIFSDYNPSSPDLIISKDSPFTAIYPLALRGDMEGVFTILDTLEDAEITSEERIKKVKLYQRFIYESEAYDFKTTDTLIIGFVSRFHSYWKTVMLGKSPIGLADSLFSEDMCSYLFTHHFRDQGLSLSSIRDDLHKYGNKFLEDKGYHSNAFGKTAHLYDLFLWKSEETVVYPIQLINDSVRVEVHFMKGLIATGWAHYATLGRSYAGGWATKKALYAVDKAYDRNTENFKVSYLTHEGQHFADYITFPNLQQADLEYRAKLVELFYSAQTTKALLRNFQNNALPDESNAHSFANYCVMRDLLALYKADRPLSKEISMENIPVDVIRQMSLSLFQRHTRVLLKSGSDTVTRLIK